MDIFERTCKKYLPPQPKEEEEVSISASESVEEEYIRCEEEEEICLDPKALLKELDCMKRRIRIMEGLLKLKTDECPKQNVCQNLDCLLSCSENTEICHVQKAQYKLQCQLDELIKCGNVFREEIQKINKILKDTTAAMCELQKNVCSLLEWRNTLQHEFGKCLERFEYLKYFKAEWTDIYNELKKQNDTTLTAVKTHVSQKVYLQEKCRMWEAINEIKSMLKASVEHQLTRFNNIEWHLGKTAPFGQLLNERSDAHSRSHTGTTQKTDEKSDFMQSPENR